MIHWHPITAYHWPSKPLATRLKIVEIVDLPVENRDFPSFFGCLPEGNYLVVSTYPSEK
jgi:hypothetical protein